jgi:stearoyl-CoA desaturase (delta-9 desaturase)
MNTKQNQKDWANILFLTLTPFVGIIGTGIYVFYFGIRWWEPLLFLISYLVIGLSVTAGYHRYYSHRTYECNPVVQGFFLFFRGHGPAELPASLGFGPS